VCSWASINIPSSFSSAQSSSHCPKSVVLPEVVVAKVHDLTLGLVELHPIGLSLVTQPVQISLNDLPTPGKSILPPSLVSSANLLRVQLATFVVLCFSMLSCHCINTFLMDRCNILKRTASLELISLIFPMLYSCYSLCWGRIQLL